MNYLHWVRGILPISLLLTAGCSLPVKNIFYGTTTPQTMTQWEASGKLSVIVEDDSKTANFVWGNDQENYLIRLFGPIGIGSASLEKTEYSVTLVTSDGVFSADSGEELLREHMNLNLPIKEMHYWIKGMADPNLKIQGGWEEDAEGFFVDLTQSGWNIKFAKYEHVSGLDEAQKLPKKITANFDSSTVPLSGNLPDIKVKMVIKDWEISR